jgi:hypothetical protein
MRFSGTEREREKERKKRKDEREGQKASGDEKKRNEVHSTIGEVHVLQ